MGRSKEISSFSNGTFIQLLFIWQFYARVIVLFLLYKKRPAGGMASKRAEYSRVRFGLEK